MKMGISISYVIHDDSLVHVNDDIDYDIVDNRDGITWKLKEVVHDEMGIEIRLDIKVLEPTADDMQHIYTYFVIHKPSIYIRCADTWRSAIYWIRISPHGRRVTIDQHCRSTIVYDNNNWLLYNRTYVDSIWYE